MKLYIDTTNTEKIILKVDEDTFEADSRKEKAQMLLPFIDEVLGKKGMSVQDITDIEVNTGPGSFTGIRVGVSVAQTMGWVLGVPVNGQKLDKNPSIEIKY